MLKQRLPRKLSKIVASTTEIKKQAKTEEVEINYKMFALVCSRNLIVVFWMVFATAILSLLSFWSRLRFFQIFYSTACRQLFKKAQLLGYTTGQVIFYISLHRMGTLLSTLAYPGVSTENARFLSCRCFEFKSMIIFKALKVEKWFQIAQPKFHMRWLMTELA